MTKSEAKQKLQAREIQILFNDKSKVELLRELFDDPKILGSSKFYYFNSNGNFTFNNDSGFCDVTIKISEITEDKTPEHLDEVLEHLERKHTNSEVEFDRIIEDTLGKITDLIVIKGKEYRRNNNPYHNFETGASMTGQTPERVLNGFLLKHLISYNDILNDLDNGVLPTEKIVHEKMDDIIVYMLLQKALILKRIKDENS